MLPIPAPLRTGIPRDISRGIRCHGVILFRLYYDAKECTFTGYARNGGDVGDDGGDAFNKFIPRSSKKEANNFHDVEMRRSLIYPSREYGAGAFATCAFATWFLAHLRKSKHFRQFGRLDGTNPSVPFVQ